MALTVNHGFITAPREQIQVGAQEMRNGDSKRKNRSLLVDCDADKTK